MIKLKNITKHYGKKEVINNVSLELPQNKLIAFIGSNGAGKSTLISIICRTLAKNSGEVFIDDKELREWNNSELSKRLSILRQSNHLNIRLTVRDLVSFGRYPHSQGKLTEEDEKFIDDSLSYLGLTDLQDRFLDELSGGQRQMAYIAMVIAQDTDYIFLDEPLNNLDMLHSVQIMKVLKRLVNELNKTVMIVIHDINFVSCYADYVIAMKNGQIVQDGDTKDIMNSSVLREIYGMDIDIQNIDGKNICLYYS
ncbi:ATP-binding cassette domain-containing protein [Clostridioides mangenotii]|uniref:iron ABC transporter ATP-binding protein n=1 Tax=Metaclostridioides mangenotii TaxID=1540 RepID=UPI001C0F5BB3|nr:ATP-binding cassette domain-containing protein [Clostridioides mangenotii]MBU5307423.1 ATP-binding cassette domain-containing protein [Clostridioides mangenotii]MCR1954451.1 ATP-binding cassette domain-containing protein [Clostridioides mangenotii]